MPMLEFNRAEQQLLLEAVRRYMAAHPSPPVFLVGNQAITALNQRRRTPGPVRVQLPSATVNLLRAAVTDQAKQPQADVEALLTKLEH